MTQTNVQRGSRAISPGFLRGIREALGVPAAVLGAGYLGFGALAKASGFSIWFTTISTVVIWALPGQLVLLDMSMLGAPFLAIVAAVLFANARFLPMAVTLLPVVRDDRSHRAWHYYFAAHVVAMMSWAICMRRCPDLPPKQRLGFFLGLSWTCLTVCVGTGAIGYLIAGSIPHLVQIGLVFMTPIYLFVLLIGEARGGLAMMALACGALAGPLIHIVSPQWSVLLGGLVGGTAAYLLRKALVRHG